MVANIKFYEKANKAQNRETVIFVEGDDDASFLETLLENVNADPAKVGIVSVGGNAKFYSELQTFTTKNPSFTQRHTKRFAIVCDADDNPHEVEKKINTSLQNVSKDRIASGEWVAGKGGIAIGLFVMPRTGFTGDLEKLCLDTVCGNTIEAAAENFIAAAENTAAQNKTPLHGSRHKRKAQVFLAGTPGELCRGAGRGFRNGLFNAKHEALQPLMDFLAVVSK